MQKSIRLRNLDENQIKLIVDVLQNVLLENGMLDKSIKYIFQRNRQLSATERADIKYNIFQLLYYWMYLAQLFKRETRNVSGIVFTAHKKEEILLDELKDSNLRHSIPWWMEQLGIKEYGEEWDAIANALNTEPPRAIRCNRLLIDTVDLENALKKEAIDCARGFISEDAIIIKGKSDIFKTISFQDGLFELQDEASQEVSRFVNPKPGDRIADTCAGNGGKSLHLAALMRNKGKVIALDIYGFKLDELKLRARRAKVDIVERKLAETTKDIKRMNGSFDKVLIDAPCTGSGVFRRNPDAKYKLKEDQYQTILNAQKEILEFYARLAKPGGEVVYATCSVFKSEGEEQVQNFLNKHPEFTLLEEKRYFPHLHNTDGFYMAKLLLKKD